MGALIDFYNEYQSRELVQYDLPAIINAQYEVKACIKMTQEKQVYLIVSKTDGRKYILKAVDSQCHENLEEEYKLHLAISHPGVIISHEFIKGKECNYLIQDYVEGNTISELVEMTENGYLDCKELLQIAVQLCDILQYLHSQKPPIIHRDIKPDNVIITKHGECKLIDFGISRRFHQEHETDTVIMGTKFAAPPEQYGFAQTDARSDIYSIGVLMFYMATGSLNIRELNEYQMPGEIKRIIIKCTQFSPEARYKSVKQLKARLNWYPYLHQHKKQILTAITGIVILAAITGVMIDQWKIPEIPTSASQPISEALPGAAPDQSDLKDMEQKAESSKTLAADIEGSDTGQGENFIDGQLSTRTSAVASLPAADTAYEFQSPLIETAVREILGKSDTASITYDDLGQITSLYICGEQIYRNWEEHFVYGKNQYMNASEYTEKNLYSNNGGITSLEDISYMKNLEYLALYNQKISNLTPLKDLQYLSRLGVGLNNIDDLEPLLSLARLSLLDISANPISNDDIVKLSALPNLYGLDIGATYVTSIYGIKELPLGSLSVFDCKVGDCVGLEDMTSLETFITTGVNNTITDIAIDRIVKLVNLKAFKIFGSDSFELSKLSTLKSLSLLDLCGMKIDNLKGLNNPSIEQLYISGWNSLDLTGVDSLANATLISLRDSVCSDYTPLLKVPNLQIVDCNKEQAERIKEQLGEVPFQISTQ